MLKSIPTAVVAITACAIAAPLNGTKPNGDSVDIHTPNHFFVGEGTVYYQEGNAGSCGEVHGDDELIAAFPLSTMDGYKSGLCGRRLRILNEGADYDGVGGVGLTVDVTLKDSCAACVGNDVDLSAEAWRVLTEGSPDGRIWIHWQWI